MAFVGSLDSEGIQDQHSSSAVVERDKSHWRRYTPEVRRAKRAESLTPKREELSKELLSIPEEGRVTHVGREADGRTGGGSARNRPSSMVEHTTGIDENCVPDTSRSSGSPKLNLAPKANRQIQMTQTLFKTSRQQEFEAVDHESQLRQAMELFHQGLVQKSVTPSNPQSSEVVASSKPPTNDDFILIESDKSSNSQNSESETGETAAAAAKFEQLRRVYLQKEEAGMASLEDEIRFRKAEGQEKQRTKLQARKRAYEEDERAQQDVIIIEDSDQTSDNEEPDEGLFVTDDEGRAPRRRSLKRSKPSEVEGELSSKKPRKARLNRIPEKALIKSLEAGTQPLKEAAAKQARKKRRLKSPAKRPEERVRVKSRGGKAKKLEAKTKKQQGRPQKGPTMTNIPSLLRNDIVGDAQAMQDREGQAVFAAKNRRGALAELIASVPEEHRKPHMQTKKALDDACKQFTRKGPGTMRADGGKWRLKGMKTSLLPHQLLGAAWMRQRENSSGRPWGGLIADSMGFGKTIMCLSNILDGQPSKASSSGTTLIVCPSSLCVQWLDQIQTHVEPGVLGRTMLYRSGNRIVTDDNIGALSECGVVITTYHEVMRSYPNIQPPIHLHSDEAKDRFWKEEYEHGRGNLHRIFFRRIILDEATVIKNHRSKVSIACCGLVGKYRWVVTGTPIHNSIEELYPYFKFAQLPQAGNFETFKQNFCGRSQTAMQRLHTFLRTMMLRRTLSDEMFGRPILKLPPIDRQTILVDFNPTERAIYQTIKSRFIAKINDWSKRGAKDNQFKCVWSLYLRLRQLCGHLLLIRNTIWELLSAEDIDKLRMLTTKSAESIDDSQTMDALRKILDNPPSWVKKGQRDSVARDGDGDGIPDGSDRSRGSSQNPHNMRKWDEDLARSYCHKCRDVPEEPHITVPCGHVYCKECLLVMVRPVSDPTEGKATCLGCQNEFERYEPYKGPEQASLSADGLARRRSSHTERTSSPVELRDADYLDSADAIVYSTKTAAVKAQMVSWLSGDQTTKIIVFTQFLYLIRILGHCCSKQGWSFCEFKGTMGPDQRSRAVQDFKNKPEVRVMLASMRCGGVGLNLTMANKVILHDLWWNEAAEDQAWSRVYRIGQEKEVDIRRFCVRDTIDTNFLLTMQDRKTKEIDWAIGPNSQPDNVPLESLMRLFGPVAIDYDTGQPVVNEAGDSGFIYVDEDEIDENSDGEVPSRPPPRPF